MVWFSSTIKLFKNKICIETSKKIFNWVIFIQISFPIDIIVEI